MGVAFWKKRSSEGHDFDRETFRSMLAFMDEGCDKEETAVVVVSDLRHCPQILRSEALEKNGDFDVSLTVRVNVDDENRKKRGWVPDEKRDRSQGSVELDFWVFDTVIDNNADGRTAPKGDGGESVRRQVKAKILPLVSGVGPRKP